MLKQIERDENHVLIDFKAIPKRVYAVGPAETITPCRIMTITCVWPGPGIAVGVETSGRKHLFFDLENMFETLEEAAIMAEKRAKNGLNTGQKAQNGKGVVSVAPEESDSVGQGEAAP